MTISNDNNHRYKLHNRSLDTEMEKVRKKDKTMTASYDQITRQMRTDNKSYRKKKLKDMAQCLCMELMDYQDQEINRSTLPTEGEIHQLVTHQ